jgi:2-polyprenyl-6-methoxyphenol hydroxylase-like FAD-dependent oxidoreductase
MRSEGSAAGRIRRNRAPAGRGHPESRPPGTTAPAGDYPARPARVPLITHPPSCIVVGGGPAGAYLALRLARERVPVLLLERYTDFDRRFRGNTLNPASLHLLARLAAPGGGTLAEAALALPHTRTEHFTAVDASGAVRFADFGRLDDPFPFVALMQQAHLLPLLLDAASGEPDFQLATGASVTGLIEEGGAVRGVAVEHGGRTHQIRAPLVVACDGRHSTVRRLARLAPRPIGAAIDVLWFTAERQPGHDAEAGAYFRFGEGLMLALMDAGTHWQVGAIIRKGSFDQVRQRGLDDFRRRVVAAAPLLAGRPPLAAWDEVFLLEVQVDRLPRWHRPGLLCLGDAAHAMSPVGMVGINVALLDAEEAAARLAPALRAGAVPEALLAEVQRRRQRGVALVQRAQALIHGLVLEPALAGRRGIRQPLRALMASGPATRLATRLIAYGR